MNRSENRLSLKTTVSIFGLLIFALVFAMSVFAAPGSAGSSRRPYRNETGSSATSETGTETGTSETTTTTSTVPPIAIVTNTEFASMFIEKIGGCVDEIAALDGATDKEDAANLKKWAKDKGIEDTDWLDGKTYPRAGDLALILCEAAGVEYSSKADALAKLQEKGVLKGRNINFRIKSRNLDLVLKNYKKAFFKDK